MTGLYDLVHTVVYVGMVYTVDMNVQTGTSSCAVAAYPHFTLERYDKNSHL